jgi:hypothetical protein
MKKCATLVGIGLELYDDSGTNDNQSGNRGGYQNSYQKPAQHGTGSYKPYAKETPAKPVASFKEADLTRIKELKAILGVSNNNGLDPFIKEFTGNADATFKEVTPANIANFNKFLEDKVR